MKKNLTIILFILLFPAGIMAQHAFWWQSYTEGICVRNIYDIVFNDKNEVQNGNKMDTVTQTLLFTKVDTVLFQNEDTCIGILMLSERFYYENFKKYYLKKEDFVKEKDGYYMMFLLKRVDDNPWKLHVYQNMIADGILDFRRTNDVNDIAPLQTYVANLRQLSTKQYFKISDKEFDVHHDDSNEISTLLKTYSKHELSDDKLFTNNYSFRYLDYQNIGEFYNQVDSTKIATADRSETDPGATVNIQQFNNRLKNAGTTDTNSNIVLSDTGWVYIGAFSKDTLKFVYQYFVFATHKLTPKEMYNDTGTYKIIMSRGSYLRANAPKKINGVYTKGKIIDNINEKEIVTVTEIKLVPSSDGKLLIWTKVHRLRKK